MVKKLLYAALVMALGTSAAFGLALGDNRPALANYQINNVAPNYHGAWWNIDSWNGKGVVAVHWKAS
jgi:hypothetical protein